MRPDLKQDRSEAVTGEISRRLAIILDRICLIPFHGTNPLSRTNGAVATDEIAIVSVIVGTVGTDKSRKGISAHDPVAPLIADVSGKRLIPYSSGYFFIAWTDKCSRVCQKVGITEKSQGFITFWTKPLAAINGDVMFIVTPGPRLRNTLGFVLPDGRIPVVKAHSILEEPFPDLGKIVDAVCLSGFFPDRVGCMTGYAGENGEEDENSNVFSFVS